MSEPEYNNQVITKYLLGSLAEAEVERLDELSFTDDAFAAALQSAEKDLVDLYARGELTGIELEKFKSHYLASPLRREKVGFAKAFQVFAEQNFPETNEENSTASEPTPKRIIGGFLSSAVSVFASPYPALKWGLVTAGLVIVCLGGWLWFANTRLVQPTNDIQAEQHTIPQQREQDRQNQSEVPRSTNTEAEREQARLNEEERERREQELEKERARQQQKQQRIADALRASRQQQPSPAKISVASFILLPPMRGSNSIQNLSIPPRTNYVAMQLQLESDDYANYRVALADQSGNKTIWRSGMLKTKTRGENKVLTVRFPANFLKTQIYSLVVSGVNSDGQVEIISNYPFGALLK